MNILRMLGFPLGRLMRPFRTVLSVYCDKAIHNSPDRPFARPSSLTLEWMRPDCLSDSLTATADCGLAYAQQQDDGPTPGRRLPVVQAANSVAMKSVVRFCRRGVGAHATAKAIRRPVIICAVCPIGGMRLQCGA